VGIEGAGFASVRQKIAAPVQVGVIPEIRSNARDKFVLANFSISHLAADDVILAVDSGRQR
jgi:hypothetical protein